MWQAITNFIMTYLDPIGIVVGLVLAIPVFWTWWQVVFGERRRQRKLFQELRKAKGTRPGILILDLLPGRNVRMQVEQYRQQDDVLKTIPDERLEQVIRSEWLTPEAMPKLHEEIRWKLDRLMQQGVNRIHLFLAGPVVGAAVAGAAMGNMPVTVYQYQQGEYINFGPLKLDF